MPYIHSIARRLPEHTISNVEAEALLAPFFTEAGEDPQIVHQIFENAAIERRYVVRPAEFYLKERSLTVRNQVYVECAKELGLAAARAAIDEAGLKAEDIDLIIDTSCTGFMIPALSAHIANELGMRRSVRRLPLTEVGCAAGAVALSLALDHINFKPEARALIVSTELPSLTAQLGDMRRANLVSSAIFGDGAAAAVIAADRPKTASFELLASRSVLFEDSTDVMGFLLNTQGFQIILSPRIPFLVKKRLRGEVDAFLEEQGIDLAELKFFALHPGGTKVLDNVRDVLGLEEEQVRSSRETLLRYGNLSSASVLYVAKALLEEAEFRSGDLGFLCAMGPGFALEMLLIRGVREAE